MPDIRDRLAEIINRAGPIHDVEPVIDAILREWKLIPRPPTYDASRLIVHLRGDGESWTVLQGDEEVGWFRHKDDAEQYARRILANT